MRSALLLAALTACAAEFPETSISNGIVEVRIHLPDPVKGSYRGTRFDWSGDMFSIRYKGHEFSGQWYERHDPKIHDAIMGPVEEFRTGDSALGYAEAAPGGTFVRIGVGVVRKPEGEASYQMFRTYDIVDPGKWTVRQGRDWISFTHRLSGPAGYAYEYTKTVRLPKGKPQLEILHALRNTGDRTIETSVYNHNFFVIDNQVVGPDVSIGFGYDPKPARDLKGMAGFKARRLEYTRDLEKGESVMTEVDGFGPAAKDNAFDIENRKSGARVFIRGDRPITKLLFWSIRTVACPEPYVALSVAPGKTEKWAIRYEFEAK